LFTYILVEVEVNMAQIALKLKNEKVKPNYKQENSSIFLFFKFRKQYLRLCERKW